MTDKVTIDKDTATAILGALDDAYEGCDHSVGICQCSVAELKEELSAAIDGRKPWWIEMDQSLRGSQMREIEL